MGQQELVPAAVQEQPSSAMLGGGRPAEIVAVASDVATAVSKIVEDKRLYTTIGRKKHVHVDGWVAMLAMLGVVPREVSATRLEDGSYVGVVELYRISDGKIVGRGSNECGMDESDWAKKPNYARRSMAVTRATGKAARLGFSWLMELAGYAPTPAEEMQKSWGGPPHSVDDERPFAASPPKPSEVVCVHFGKNGGTPVTELSSRQLSWYMEKAATVLLDEPDDREYDLHKALFYAAVKEDATKHDGGSLKALISKRPDVSTLAA